MDSADPIITAGRLRAGVWEAELRSPDGRDALPPLEGIHLERGLPGLEITPAGGDAPGRWQMRLPIPADCLGDGVQTVVLRNADSGARIASLSIVAGEALDDDLRAEIDLLRAELDMLKKAFRRHCLETAR